jgi:hypothetical protein
VIHVLKADGKSEDFSEQKLLDSIKRAGITENMQPLVVDHVKNNLYENIPSSEIYRHIEEFFGKSNDTPSKSKYSLKRALMELGPTGYPFETYISEVLKAKGYSTQVDQTLSGKCVNHEVDIIAIKENEKIMVECKFHNRPGIRSDLHVSLYTKARFDDLREKHGFTKAMLATNTKITSDGLSYAQCENLDVLSWSFPEDESLRNIIEKYKLYPITQLSSISFSQKQEFLQKAIVLISQICNNSDLINQITIPNEKRDEILSEARNISGL